MAKGLLIVLSGPSGVGKGTLRMEIMKKENLNLWFSVSMTTRPRRKDEVNGREYFFVSKEEFLDSLERGELLEHNTFVDNYYGTPARVIEQKRSEGTNVLLEIDTNGARQVMSALPPDDVLSIFVLPPSLQDLAARLKHRGTESDDIIEKRVNVAKNEIEYSKDHYKYHVVNDDLHRCAEEIESIILKEQEKLK